jgi:DNA-binding CsgD family transcriptional regulator
MLQGAFMSVMEVRSPDELRDEVVRFANELGFEKVTAMAVIDRPLAQPEFFSVDNTPVDYRASFEDAQNCRRDPVLQHCKHASVPIIWDQQTYTSCGLGDKWEAQALYGYRTGIALALHLPEGKHFVLGVDRDQPVPAHKGELTRVVADLQLFAVLAQDAALRILVPPTEQTESPALTPRELECLRWTMDGKTAWEIGSILGIVERTVVLHVNSAMHKLDCVSKHQAVVKALRLGLIR